MKGLKTTLATVIAVGLLAGSAVGVAAQGAEPPAEFTGRLVFGPQVAFGSDVEADGRTESRGNAFRTPVTAMSDERLDGTWTRTNNIDFYEDPPVWTWQANWHVETEGGAWEGIETPIVFSDESRSTTTAVLVGEGAHDGLTAVIEFDQEGEGWDLRGVIIDGDMPPPPESAAE